MSNIHPSAVISNRIGAKFRDELKRRRESGSPVLCHCGPDWNARDQHHPGCELEDLWKRTEEEVLDNTCEGGGCGKECTLDDFGMKLCDDCQKAAPYRQMLAKAAEKENFMFGQED